MEGHGQDPEVDGVRAPLNHAVIACEGPACNGGLSARQRENAIIAEMPGQNHELKLEAEKFARSTVTKQLRLTEHTRLERTSAGYVIYSCDECGAERVYGNSVRTYFGLGYPAEEAQ